MLTRTAAQVPRNLGHPLFEAAERFIDGQAAIRSVRPPNVVACRADGVDHASKRVFESGDFGF